MLFGSLIEREGDCKRAGNFRIRLMVARCAEDGAFSTGDSDDPVRTIPYTDETGSYRLVVLKSTVEVIFGMLL